MKKIMFTLNFLSYIRVGFISNFYDDFRDWNLQIKSNLTHPNNLRKKDKIKYKIKNPIFTRGVFM